MRGRMTRHEREKMISAWADLVDGAMRALAELAVSLDAWARLPYVEGDDFDQATAKVRAALAGAALTPAALRTLRESLVGDADNAD